MKSIYTLKKTIPSGSHNAPYSPELGNHWPEGQEFHKLPLNRQRWTGRVAFEQIGGEEVIITVPEGTVPELFIEAKIRKYICSACGVDHPYDGGECSPYDYQ